MSLQINKAIKKVLQLNLVRKYQKSKNQKMFTIGGQWPFHSFKGFKSFIFGFLCLTSFTFFDDILSILKTTNNYKLQVYKESDRSPSIKDVFQIQLLFLPNNFSLCFTKTYVQKSQLLHNLLK